MFQSRDWVDVYSGPQHVLRNGHVVVVFQSRDWVDVYSGPPKPTSATSPPQLFQSRDWVDVYSGTAGRAVFLGGVSVSIPRLG